MNYIKSAGFFSIFYVILYFGLSIGLRFFITDSDLFTGLFYVVLLAATLIYLKICGDDIKNNLTDSSDSYWIVFSYHTSSIYDPSGCRIHYTDRKFIF